MLYRLEKLLGASVAGSDGEFGRIKDVYFDDQRWAVRYLVVDTGNWLTGRKVLIAPISVGSIDWEKTLVNVELTQLQVETSPNIDTDQPVSRQHESDLYQHYGYPYYWSGPYLWGATPHPVRPVGALPSVGNGRGERGGAPAGPHLRSAKEVAGYHLLAVNNSLGHVADFLFENATWAIRYLVINARNWLPGKHVVIPPQWIRGVDWMERVVHVDVSRSSVQAAPEYHSTLEFSRLHETNLYSHYRRPGYWQ
jgi:uncharacterized protein YrrD